ncbi:tricarboxylate transporter [Halomonas sp. 1513]|nr:tricarboxylate transporter [Halomonas sp. 1513]APX93487.1 tricarboxylate transporter [Halomonas sp. 1513]
MKLFHHNEVGSTPGAGKFIKAGVLSAALLLGGYAHADGNVPSNVTFTVPFGVGGGTDVWARFLAPWLTEYLDSEPTIMIDNVPGGGSINGANVFARRASSDGSHILATSASTQFPAMLNEDRVRYDYADWVPVLASPTGGVVYASSELGEDKDAVMAALLETPVKFAAQTPTGLEMPVLMALDMLEMDVTAVFGMRSRGEGRLAFERGEAKIDFQTTSAYFSSVEPLVEAGDAIPLFSLGMLNDEGELVRDPAFPDLPTFSEIYVEQHGVDPEGPAYEAFRQFFAAGFALQKLIMLPADTPQGVIDEYRNAVNAFIGDERFLEESEAQLGPYSLVSGDVAERHLSDVMTLDESTREWLSDWLDSRFGASI